MPNLDYEVACQAIGQLIAHAVTTIADEEQKATPDQARLANALSARQTLVAARDALAHDDLPAIAATLTLYGPTARRLNG
ncbi:hypothetical protein KTD33_30500 [Burkholderia gladioli]|uniref:hypothetical protein n=1 Tax=Burkholderia gladioli TaxID=28095 RepID=UPI001C248D1C|nr:hypothetical protein [Burkholderia gladioli]MBU9198860.1 hypothetical protein [Burkholderia gladioli]